ncbi:hypothetical protein JHK82_027515 [Glycine max]|nr:hypothetical protein JHK87_027406 [Glycine soja]KAG5003503.1 hypothetical protein JHK86_027642 [Glycine max]KAG5126680.1 hypothetical protein JHK82_027515 [Glycine max]KAG5151296.1 hypothetical protein JHK84_027768 [Glycine max]
MRLCVQIDLSIAVVGKFNLNGSWYYVEYKGLHILCVECGCYGHVARNYTKAEMKTQRMAMGVHKAMQGVRDNEAIHARPSEPTAETRQRMDIGKPLLRFISLAYPK